MPCHLQKLKAPYTSHMRNLYWLIIFVPSSIHAQSESDKVMEVVNNVFTAMRTNDSTLLNQCFVETPNTFTVVSRDGESRLVKGDFSAFSAAVGKPKEKVWNEPIWNEKVSIDGGLASVWVDYAFYLDDQFSHCGIDAFHLVKKNGEWKIFHLVDTRRKENCEIPEWVVPR